MAGRDTRGDTTRAPSGAGASALGAVVVFSGTPRFLAFPLSPAKALGIGRDDAIGALLGDERLSRHHAEIVIQDGELTVRDLGSRNGTFVRGVQIKVQETHIATPCVVRAGSTVMLLVSDLASRAGKQVQQREGLVIGALFGEALGRVERAARSSTTLLVRGETGTGKEIAARRYHDASPHASGPFSAINCATIPEGVAERLLFGARRGAYSGAVSDSEGVVQAADGGTLFLDEIGELDLAVQAKLLRVLETREVVALGAARPRKVDVHFCFATHRDLRREVGRGRFREDLFYRLGDHEVVLPALRDRLEDVPWLLSSVVAEVDATLTLHPKLVETCMLRGWPGNVRELLREGRRAAEAARDAGERSVRADHLRSGAGDEIPVSGSVFGGGELPASAPSLTDVRSALGAASGNVSEAARSLGIHRTQLRRTMRKLGLTSSKT